MLREGAGRVRAGIVSAFVGLVGLALAPGARAFEYFDGRIQVHGYLEEQVRAISADFNQQLDLTQWYNVLNIEMDVEIAPDGWGPFDSVGAFFIGEVRYDCVWTRACGISASSNNFGNRSTSLPTRLNQAVDPRMVGATNYQNPIVRQPSGGIVTQKIRPAFAVGGDWDTAGTNVLPAVVDSEYYRGVNQTSPFDALIDTRVCVRFGGANCATAGAVGNIDYIPGRYTFANFLNYGFALRAVRGGVNGFGTQAMPWDPKDNIDPQGTLADRANPFRPGDVNPVVGIAGQYGTGPLAGQSLPFRPGPTVGPLGGQPWQAQGLFVPSQPYAEYLRDGGSDPFQQNYSQERLAWNLGASQSQTWFLKEAYIELEMLEGRLFMRLGRQNIVWGKTELFATTDIFNPRDLALGSLTSLEESRIPVWAARAIYSFYDVGPFEDVRLEVAVDLDTFYSDDLGRCGEPYTPNPVCDKTMGLLVHGLTGLAVAGEDRPDMWWNSAEALQGGARLEFRWDRFSFAIVDFWSYTKLPYAERLTTFSRNVDPISGRPRRYGATGDCPQGDPSNPAAIPNDPDCLQGGTDALVNSPLNQQLYAVICSSSLGFSSLDRSVCATSVFASDSFSAAGVVSVAQLVSQLLAGSVQGISTVANNGFAGPTSRIPIVSLSIDPADIAKNATVAGGGPSGLFAFTALNTPNFSLGGFLANHNQAQTLSQVTTVQQQALLGCGPFYGTPCDGGASNAIADATPAPGGVDLLNAEASALIQSWTGFDGSTFQGALATDKTVAQPGTVGFQGGPVCTRTLADGSQVMLPGCRGPGDPGYDPAVDGGNPNLVSIGFPAGVGAVPALGNAALGPIEFVQGHPFTGQTWRSEMAALSWNFEMTLVAFSTDTLSPSISGDPGSDPSLRFDKANAFRTDGCSYVVPWKCSAVRAFWGILGTQRNTLEAGGNGRFGRRDFSWAVGGDVVLSYQKRNVLGFSMDFAEDVTKTNWGVEASWVANNPFTNNNEFDGISKEDTYNLTISVDRPTFINFLNQSRTFFFNSQWFFNYTPGYNRGFTANGPWNVFFTFTTQTGYFQDRLLPGITWVYDFQSNSGASLPQITYRFTESFSATFGFALFWGRYQGKEFPLNPLTPGNQTGRYAYQTWVENGLAVIRDRDEVFLRIRYTF
ncbi:hypothetical protein MYXO_02958 [Myxococcaceae bacterium]|jgi:hypothetical protein|nr:hypothetical protein MYXO_02958 [Myxococcaceae bacterium]